MPVAVKKRLTVACPSACSLNPEKIGPGITGVLLEMRANGAGSPSMTRRFIELSGHPFAQTNMERHLKHYKELDPEPEEPSGAVPDEKLGDLDILDRIIQQGARNSRNWKPTIKDTLEAMKLKMQITGNSAFDNMLAAMEAGLQLAEGVPEDEIEAPEALLSPDERPEEEELGEVLV